LTSAVPRRSFCQDCRERGAAAVEFAIIFPILLLLVLGLIEVGRAIWTQTTLDYAVQAAARCVAISPKLCLDVPTYAARKAFGLTFDDPASVFVVTSGSCSVDANGIPTGAEVTASLPFDWLAPAFFPNPPFPQTLKARACFRFRDASNHKILVKSVNRYLTSILACNSRFLASEAPRYR
jgi:Flp pilus assembly pilin Flp